MPSPPPGGLPGPGAEPRSPASPALAGGFFTTSATWKLDLWWKTAYRPDEALQTKSIAKGRSPVGTADAPGAELSQEGAVSAPGAPTEPPLPPARLRKSRPHALL